MNADLCFLAHRKPKAICGAIASVPTYQLKKQMTTPAKILIDLETKFWQSMVDQDTGAALKLLHD